MMQDDIGDEHKDRPHKDPATKNVSVNLGFRLPKLPKKDFILKIGVWLLIAGVVVAIWKWPAKNTIPADIRSQISFHAIFPTKDYSPNSFQYSASRHILQFNTTESGIKVQVTEQPLPTNSGDNPAQDPSQMLSQLGVRYFTQAQSKLGVISVAKFWTKSYDPNGQTAILGTRGTLVLAHPASDLSLDQWTRFFNSLAL